MNSLHERLRSAFRIAAETMPRSNAVLSISPHAPGHLFCPRCGSGLSNTERKRLHSIAHTCGSLGGHGAWWFWPRTRH